MNLEVRIAVIFMVVASSLIGQNNLQTANFLGQTEKLDQTEKHTAKYKHSLGASFFILGNFLSDSPDYYLLTYGNRLTIKDRIFVEFNT